MKKCEFCLQNNALVDLTYCAACAASAIRGLCETLGGEVLATRTYDRIGRMEVRFTEEDILKWARRCGKIWMNMHPEEKTDGQIK